MIMKKCVLSFLAACVAAIPSFGQNEVAVNDQVNLTDNLIGEVFAIVEKEAFVTVFANSDTPPAGALEIQDSYSIDGYVFLPVAIKESGFRGCEDLTSVKVCSAISTIPSYAFADCKKLRSFTEAKSGSIELIGNYAFYKTYALSEINLPKCKTIVDYAFNGSGVKKVNIPEIQYIYAGGFYECKSLSEFNGGEKLREIGNVAFCNAGPFPSITLGPDLTKIGNLAFAFLPGLKEIVIPENIKSIGKDAFSGLAMERVFILNSNFMDFCDASRLLRNKYLKEIYCDQQLNEDIKTYIETGSEEHKPEFLASQAIVKPLSDIVEVKQTSTPDYFSAFERIDGISFLTLFNPETGDLIPNKGEGYHITDDHVGVRCWIDKVNLLQYVTDVNRPSGMEEIDAASDDYHPVYYDLQGNIVANPSKGIFIVKKGSEVYKVIK